MLEKGEKLHKKALDLPYDSKYMWEYIDYPDGWMSAPMEKFTIGELTEPFLTYEEFAGQREKEMAEFSDKEITGRKDSRVTTEELLGQNHSYEVPIQRNEMVEENKKEPAVPDAQVQKKSENNGQTE